MSQAHDVLLPCLSVLAEAKRQEQMLLSHLCKREWRRGPFGAEPQAPRADLPSVVNRSLAVWSVATFKRIAGGEDQGYFDNPMVAGSSPAGPRGSRSSIGRAAECALIAGSPAGNDKLRGLIGAVPDDSGAESLFCRPCSVAVWSESARRKDGRQE